MVEEVRSQVASNGAQHSFCPSPVQRLLALSAIQVFGCLGVSLIAYLLASLKIPLYPLVPIPSVALGVGLTCMCFHPKARDEIKSWIKPPSQPHTCEGDHCEQSFNKVLHWVLFIDVTALGLLIASTGGIHESPFHPFLLIVFPIYLMMVTQFSRSWAIGVFVTVVLVFSACLFVPPEWSNKVNDADRRIYNSLLFISTLLCVFIPGALQLARDMSTKDKMGRSSASVSEEGQASDNVTSF